MPNLLACPRCGSADDLVEHVIVPATDRVRISDTETFSYDWGPAEVDWDSSDPTKLECTACGWSATVNAGNSGDIIRQLVPEPQNCAGCGKPIRLDDEGGFIHWHSGLPLCYATTKELADLEAEIERLRSSRATA
jgi:hypothetical protein